MNPDATQAQFPFRPSGKDWDRLLVAVAENEERKRHRSMYGTIGLVDLRVVSGIAVQRAGKVTTGDPSTLNMTASSWAEGFLFGVMFEHHGGTAGEHVPLASATVLTEAMRPDELHQTTDHPDWARMATVLEQIHQRYTTDVSPVTLYNEVCDLYAVAYLAVNRVGMTFPDASAELVTDLTDAWTEGFLYGVLFQRTGDTHEGL